MFLALVMCLGLVQVTAFAEEEIIPDEGNDPVPCACGVEGCTCAPETCGADFCNEPCEACAARQQADKEAAEKAAAEEAARLQAEEEAKRAAEEAEAAAKLAEVVAAPAAELQETSSGTCGSNVTWKMDDNGVLTISGTGEMSTYYNSVPPWRGDNLKQVVIEAGVTAIGARAFNDCPNLESISMPSTLTRIGGGDSGGVFRGCANLKALNIPEGVTVIPAYMANNCGIEVLTLPSTITSIGGYAFKDCPNLKSVTIPANASVGGFAFQGCTSLESVVIPEGVTTVGEGAFLKCSALKAVKIPSTWTVIQQSTFNGCAAIETLELPQTLTTISRYSFTGCKSLKELTIPGSVKEVGYESFRKCSALETLNVSEGVEKIDNYVFWECHALKNVSLPSSLTFLGNNALSQCDGYETVKLPENLETLSQGAFYNSKGLKSIKIPEKVTEIAACLFQACPALEHVELHDGITSIGNNAFQGCPLKLLEIPDSVTTIGSNAFVGATASLIGPQSLLTKIGTENTAKASAIYVTGDDVTSVDSINDCKVFVLNGGIVAENALTTPTKTGATFAGWYETADFSGSRVTGDTAEAGKVYYARWCTAHQWDGGVMTTAPTYTSEGVMTYTCTVCGTPRTESIGRLTYVDPYFPTFTPTYPTGGGTGTTTPPSTITDNPTPLDPGTTITDDETPLDRLPLLFRDVADDMWYRDAVAYVFDRGLMKGINETTFAPTLSTERGMIVTILHRLEGEPNAAASAFTDVAAGEWYTDAVAWGAANGVVKGYSDTIFKPTQDITREQLAAILYRYAQLKGYDTGKRADLSAYTDAGDLSAYALEAMQWAVAEELISGVTSYTLVPGGRADRAQVAMILMRFCERIVPAE